MDDSIILDFLQNNSEASKKLLKAFAKDDITLAREALVEGADPRVQQNIKTTPIILLALEKDETWLKLLMGDDAEINSITHPNISFVNIKEKFKGMTLLEAAARMDYYNGNFENTAFAFDYLIKKSGDPFKEDEKNTSFATYLVQLHDDRFDPFSSLGNPGYSADTTPLSDKMVDPFSGENIKIADPKDFYLKRDKAFIEAIEKHFPDKKLSPKEFSSVIDSNLPLLNQYVYSHLSDETIHAKYGPAANPKPLIFYLLFHDRLSESLKLINDGNVSDEDLQFVNQFDGTNLLGELSKSLASKKLFKPEEIRQFIDICKHKNIDVNFQDNAGATSLDLLIKSDPNQNGTMHDVYCDLLKQAGAVPSIELKSPAKIPFADETFLFAAIQRNRLDWIEKIHALQSKGEIEIDFFATNFRGESAIQQACLIRESIDPKIISLLAKIKPELLDASHTFTINGEEIHNVSPLNQALSRDDVTLAKQLMVLGANPFLKDRTQNIPIVSKMMDEEFVNFSFAAFKFSHPHSYQRILREMVPEITSKAIEKLSINPGDNSNNYKRLKLIHRLLQYNNDIAPIENACGVFNGKDELKADLNILQKIEEEKLTLPNILPKQRKEVIDRLQFIHELFESLKDYVTENSIQIPMPDGSQREKSLYAGITETKADIFSQPSPITPRIPNGLPNLTKFFT